jgi:chemotaxis family two-component system sensor kinase Cph1
VTSHPAFGQADLTNCERELIHLAGSIQPHGMFLAVEERTFRIVQASANAPALVQLDAQALLGQGVASLGGDLETTLRQLAQNTSLGSPVPLRCTLQANGQLRAFEGTVHRVEGGVLLVEVEPLLAPDRITATTG